MAPNTPQRSDRPALRTFEEVQIVISHVETGEDRFGKEHKAVQRFRDTQFAYQNQHQLVLPPSLEPHAKRIPLMARWRNNLTALSQVYNLYFAVYNEKWIHVYSPSCGYSTPLGDLRLKFSTQPNRLTSRIKGYLGDGGCVNQITVGRLGTHEVLVLCCDNGDVLGFYTHEIARIVRKRTSSGQGPDTGKPPGYPRNPPRSSGLWEQDVLSTDLSDVEEEEEKPVESVQDWARRNDVPFAFLNENVGISAWGLAVHAKSRLIAASSNRHEITVFAPAVADPATTRCPDIDASQPSRDRFWRIIVRLGKEANNVPNIAFLDDKDGNAEFICGVDVKGNRWIADIWNKEQPVICVPRRAEDKHETFCGWGILPLHKRHFMHVNDCEELTGVPMEFVRPWLTARPERPKTGNWWDLTYSLQYLRDFYPISAARTKLPRHLLELPQNSFLQLPAWGGMGAENSETDDEDSAEDDGGDDSAADDGGDDSAEDDGGDDSAEDDDGDDSAEDDDGGDDAGEFGDDNWAEDEPVDQDKDDDDDVYDDDVVDFFFHEAPTYDAVANGLDTMYEVLTSEELSSNSFDDPPAFHPNFDFGLASAESHGPTISISVLQQFQGQNGLISADEAITALKTGHGLFAGRRRAITSPSLETISPDEFRQMRITEALSPHTPRIGLTFTPHNGTIYRPPTTEFALSRLARDLRQPELLGYASTVRLPPNNGRSRGPANTRRLEGSPYRLLTTSCTDIELRDLVFNLPTDGTTFRDPFETCKAPVSTERYLPRSGTRRVSMIVHVPELSLVVIGSAIGRVMLITPTTLHPSDVPYGLEIFQYGYRTDWILPRRSDDKKHGLGLRSLFGIAVSPVHAGGSAESLLLDEHGVRAVPERTYRLVLHYTNHTILTYQLRRGHHGDLIVF